MYHEVRENCIMRSFIISNHQYYEGDKIKDDNLGKAYHAWEI
jgi:hypothetical protein